MHVDFIGPLETGQNTQFRVNNHLKLGYLNMKK